MNESEYFTEDNRKYVDPNISLNEQNKFVDNLRGVQTFNTNQINRQTQALGSDLPSNLGGLGGSEGLFQARYQTPQTNAMVADLKAAAQQSALNTALNNYKDMLNKKYKDAYKKYARSKSGGSTTPSGDGAKPEIEQLQENSTDLIEDPFFKNWQQQLLYQKSIEDLAKKNNMTVEEYRNKLKKQNEAKHASDSITGNWQNTINSHNTLDTNPLNTSLNLK